MFAAAMAAGAAAAFAGETAANGEPSLLGFAAVNPACHEWNDGCATCRRDAAGAVHCSTPGIACQPREVVCREPDPR
jgi:hypothetical protein